MTWTLAIILGVGTALGYTVGWWRCDVIRGQAREAELEDDCEEILGALNCVKQERDEAEKAKADLLDLAETVFTQKTIRETSRADLFMALKEVLARSVYLYPAGNKPDAEVRRYRHVPAPLTRENAERFGTEIDRERLGLIAADLEDPDATFIHILAERDEDRTVITRIEDDFCKSCEGRGWNVVARVAKECRRCSGTGSRMNYPPPSSEEHCCTWGGCSCGGTQHPAAGRATSQTGQWAQPLGNIDTERGAQ